MSRSVAVVIFCALALFLGACGGNSHTGAGGGTSVGSGTTTTGAPGMFTVGGTVAGLSGTGLVLENNNADDLAISADGSFTFATPLASGAMYAVTVKTEPSGPTQTCSVSMGTGTVGSAAVTSVRVICSTNSYNVGGTVTGLAGTGLVLQDNGGDNLSIAADGTFKFAKPVASGAPYAVTVLTQPSGPTQTCKVTNDTGTIGSADVTNVTVTCTTNKYTIGGTLSGLAATESVVLQDNGADDLTRSANGDFTFALSVSSGSSYSVTVLTNPANPSQNCVVMGGAGMVTNANITSVIVTCTTDTCPAGTNDNCVLTTTNSGSTDLGSCAAGYTGSCSFSCSLGTWSQVTDTCVAQCAAAMENGNCDVGLTNSGGTSGSCAAGFGSGSCSFSCTNGTWSQVSDSCAPAPCVAATENGNCNLSATNSGGTSGSCAAGFGSGSCSFSCTNGTWTQLSDTCAPLGYFVLSGAPNPQTVFNTIAETYSFPNNLTNSIWNRQSNVILTGEFSTHGYWGFVEGTNGYSSAPNQTGGNYHERMVQIPATSTVIYDSTGPANGVGPGTASLFYAATISNTTGLLSNDQPVTFTDGFGGSCDLASSSGTQFLCFDGTSIRQYTTAAGSGVLTFTGTVPLSKPLPTPAECLSGNACYGSTFAWDGAYYYFAADEGSSSSLNYLVYDATGTYVQTYGATGGGAIDGVYFDWSVGRYSTHDGYGNRKGGAIYASGGGNSDTHTFGPVDSAHTLQ